MYTGTNAINLAFVQFAGTSRCTKRHVDVIPMHLVIRCGLLWPDEVGCLSLLILSMPRIEEEREIHHTIPVIVIEAPIHILLNGLQACFAIELIHTYVLRFPIVLAIVGIAFRQGDRPNHVEVGREQLV